MNAPESTSDTAPTETDPYFRGRKCPPHLVNMERDAADRAFSAWDERLPVEELVTLAADEDEQVRVYAALNRQMPPEVLERLASDKVWEVRLYALTNTSLPEAAAAAMVHDRRKEVRRLALTNPKIPEVTVLRAASTDRSEEVRESAWIVALARMCRRLGVDPGNFGAVEDLCRQEWWEMTPESPAVVVALALSPNA